MGEIHVRRKVKISNETYHRLNRITDEISQQTGRHLSMESAIIRLLDERMKTSPVDFAGSWDMDDREAEEILRTIKDVGSTWRVE